ncbi:MAG: hypothetical protein LASZOEIN_002663 [Candidatus Fervidibacter sp.]|nr:hypothetical protein [Armatimonadota bacterium]
MKPERKGRRYEVILSEQAERYKSKLPSHVQIGIESKWLAENVHQVRHKQSGYSLLATHRHVVDLGKHDEVYRRLSRR